MPGMFYEMSITWNANRKKKEKKQKTKKTRIFAFCPKQSENICKLSKLDIYHIELTTAM